MGEKKFHQFLSWKNFVFIPSECEKTLGNALLFTSLSYAVKFSCAHVWRKLAMPPTGAAAPASYLDSFILHSSILIYMYIYRSFFCSRKKSRNAGRGEEGFEKKK